MYTCTYCVFTSVKSVSLYTVPSFPPVKVLVLSRFKEERFSTVSEEDTDKTVFLSESGREFCVDGAARENEHSLKLVSLNLAVCSGP